MKTTTIQLNKEVCTIETEACFEPSSSKQKHTILYVSNPFTPEELNYKGITEQPEYSIKGKNEELDKAWRKYNKAEVAIEKQIIDKAVQDGLLEPDFAKQLKWSRKAGCGCGCSPGWKSRDYRRRSMWLYVTSPSKEEEKKKRKQEYASENEAKTLASMVI